MNDEIDRVLMSTEFTSENEDEIKMVFHIYANGEVFERVQWFSLDGELTGESNRPIGCLGNDGPSGRDGNSGDAS